MIFRVPFSTSNILMRVFEFAYVQAAAKYFPLLENLSLKAPRPSVSNFQTLISGSSLGRSRNFSHLFNNYFFEIESTSFSFLPDGLEMLLSIASKETKPISLSHGAIEILFTSTSISDLRIKPSSTSRKEGYFSL